MSSTMSRRLAPVRQGILPFGVLITALLWAPAVVPAHATTADRTVDLTLKCTSNVSCDGVWFWYQGGITGTTTLGSGSISGPANSTTQGTTTQPAAANELDFSVGIQTGNNCGRGLFEYITPGSAINFTVKFDGSNNYGSTCNGSASFTMKS